METFPKRLLNVACHTYFWGTISLAVASNALHKTAADCANLFSSEAVEMIRQSFYIDDCLKSLPSVRKADDCLKSLPSVRKADDCLKSLPSVRKAVTLAWIDTARRLSSLKIGLPKS